MYDCLDIHKYCNSPPLHFLYMKFKRSSATFYIRSVKARHEEKFSKLTRNISTDVCGLDTDKIVVNLSSVTFTDTEVHLLRRGLAFSIAPPRLDGMDIQTSFECFYRQLVSNLPSGSVTRLKQ